MHIAIAGNIGSGKTTLTTLLAKHYNWQPHFEEVDENPYLNEFYDDMMRWSFNLQIYFLHSRFRQIHSFRSQNKNVIQDRTIYEDAHIFAPNLHDMGLMSSRDFNTYQELFGLMEEFIKAPDLLITSTRAFRPSCAKSKSADAPTKTASASTTCKTSTSATTTGSRATTRAACSSSTSTNSNSTVSPRTSAR